MKSEGGIGRRILVVDDEELTAQVVSYQLQGRGFQVDTLNDPLAARERLAAGGYDLVVLDYMMPRLSGLELAEWMRTQDALRELPVLLLTAKTLTLDDRERLLKVGAAVQAKPYRNYELYQRICDLLGTGEGEGRTEGAVES